MVKKTVKKILKLLAKLCLSPEGYARYLGVKIGSNILIGKDHWSSEPYLISIGNHVQITKGVCFHTHGGANVLREEFPDFDCFGKIVIEDYVYIGAGSHIMPGITVQRKALIAAGSVVTKSVPEGMVVGGNPAKIICSINDFQRKNIKYNLNTKQMSAKEKRNFILNTPNDLFIHKEFLL
jgi:acetyltransferase-like isoleucine patch superfamily enzyme